MTGEVDTAAAEAASAAEKVAKEEAEVAAAFAGGFDETKAKEPEIKPAVETPAVAATPETPPVVEPKPVVEPPKPKYVRVTQEQLDELTAAAKLVKEFGPRFDKLAGTTGSLKQAIDKVQAETPKGQKLDQAALDDLKKDFPELASHIEKIFGGIKGTGDAPSVPKPAAVDADEIKRLAREETFKDELTELAADYPDWQTVVGQSDNPDDKNPFRQWLAKQPEEYQTKINDTLSPRVIARAIDRFRAATTSPRPAQAPAKPAQIPAATARRNVVANAVTPRTAGGQPAATVKTEHDYFREGFSGSKS